MPRVLSLLMVAVCVCAGPLDEEARRHSPPTLKVRERPRVGARDLPNSHWGMFKPDNAPWWDTYRQHVGENLYIKVKRFAPDWFEQWTHKKIIKHYPESLLAFQPEYLGRALPLRFKRVVNLIAIREIVLIRRQISESPLTLREQAEKLAQLAEAAKRGNSNCFVWVEVAWTSARKEQWIQALKDTQIHFDGVAISGLSNYPRALGTRFLRKPYQWAREHFSDRPLSIGNFPKVRPQRVEATIGDAQEVGFSQVIILGALK